MTFTIIESQNLHEKQLFDEEWLNRFHTEMDSNFPRIKEKHLSIIREMMLPADRHHLLSAEEFNKEFPIQKRRTWSNLQKNKQKFQCSSIGMGALHCSCLAFHPLSMIFCSKTPPLILLASLLGGGCYLKYGCHTSREIKYDILKRIEETKDSEDQIASNQPPDGRSLQQPSCCERIQRVIDMSVICFGCLCPLPLACYKSAVIIPQRIKWGVENQQRIYLKFKEIKKLFENHETVEILFHNLDSKILCLEEEIQHLPIHKQIISSNIPFHPILTSEFPELAHDCYIKNKITLSLQLNDYREARRALQNLIEKVHTIALHLA